MSPDLTPIATEQQLLRAIVRHQAEVDALLDASFAARGYLTCACGATIDEQGQTTCYPCRWRNRRADLYPARGRGAE